MNGGEHKGAGSNDDGTVRQQGVVEVECAFISLFACFERQETVGLIGE